jgi:molybdopterin/thiamine biosynthesis adenylyltransferase
MVSANRHVRIIRLPGIGHNGFEKLQKAAVALVGCGTLGSVYAENLVRLGIGHLKLNDRDVVEEHNLCTQFLYDEADLRNTVPKAIAAKMRLQKINSKCAVTAQPFELCPENAVKLLSEVDVIIDATDNFETRFLINDTSVKLGIPWIYTGVVGFTGLCMAIVPGETACLRCFMEAPPPAGSLPTCETAGVWPAAAQVIASIGLTETLRLLTGDKTQFGLSEIDLQSGHWKRLYPERKRDCSTCSGKKLNYLEGKAVSEAAKLCGRDMVHIQPERELSLNLAEIARRFPQDLEVKVSDELLHLTVEKAEIFLFRDGRALVKGISDVSLARNIYQRYICV